MAVALVPRRRRDLGRLLARFVCAVLGLIGLLPPLLAVVTRTAWMRQHTAGWVQGLLKSELGLTASFGLGIELLPPAVTLSGLVLPSNDGRGPAVEAARVKVAPRIFSLLGGKLDVGDIEIERPRVRLVIAGGKPANLDLKLPEGGGGGAPLTRLPLRSVALSGANVALDLADAGVKLALDDLDVDATTGAGISFDVSLYLGGGEVHRRRAVEGGEAVDDDALCEFSARLHYGEGEVLVRKLSLEARLDDDPAAGAPPSCVDLQGERRVAVGLHRLRVRQGSGPLPVINGRVNAQAPLRVINRFVPGAPRLSGDVGLDVEAAYSGQRELPEVKGQLRASEVVLFGLRTIAHALDARVETTTREARIPEAHVKYADGEVILRGVKAQPFEEGIPVEVAEAELVALQFPGLMRDLGITRHTIVQWLLESGTIRNFRGKVADPARKGGPSFIGDIEVQTSNFEVTDLAWDNPRRQRMIGVKQARVKGKFGVEPHGIIFRQMTADLPRSHLDVPSVTVGFSDLLEVRVGEATQIDFSEISPLASLPVAGRVEVKGGVCCRQSDPVITGDVKATAFRMADMPLADTMTGHVVFRPMVLEFTQVKATKSTPIKSAEKEAPRAASAAEPAPGKKPRGKGAGVSAPTVSEAPRVRVATSSYEAPLIRMDFGRPQGLLVEGNVTTKAMDARVLLSIFQFENDPRFTEIAGSGDAQATMRFEVGGPNDPCKTGVMAVRGQATLGALDLYGEHYDGGSADFDYLWFDRAAMERGIEAKIHALKLRKGRGVIFGAGEMSKGAQLTGHFIAHDIPLSRLDAMADLGRLVDGSVSAAGTIGGTVESPRIMSAVTMSSLRIGQRTLPPSSFSVELEPSKKEETTAPQGEPSKAPKKGESPRRYTRCGIEIPRPFDLDEYNKDSVKGVFHTRGALFGEQIKLDDVQTTWQRAKSVSGTIHASNLDLAAMFQLSPTFVLSDRPPVGQLSGRVEIASYEMDHPERARVKVALEKVDIKRGSSKLNLKLPQGANPVELQIANDTLDLPRMGFGVTVGATKEADIELGGTVSKLTTERQLALAIRLTPIEIKALLEGTPKIDSASGKLEGSLAISGKADAPIMRGEVKLHNGSLSVRGLPVSIEGLDLLARVDEHELRVVQATAKVGGGRLSAAAWVPLRGFQIGEVTARLDATDVRLPISEGVEMTTNSSLAISWTPPGPDGARKRAQVTGNVDIQNFTYTRPIFVSADLDALARRKRTEVVVYDPEEDVADIAINVRAARPFVFRNNLIEADVSIDSSALLMTGTNQRFGLQGQLRVDKGGRLKLRNNEFDIQQGIIRFDDPTRIAPRVDLRASTEYRRYTSSSASASGSSGGPPGGSSGGAPASSGQGGISGSAGGVWRLSLHAHGDADNLKLDLMSEPNLAQEDIVLLLTIGITRAELDQIQASNLGSTAALEALSALSGADRAVKTVLPIIDDFRFGSAYSTRTGRTEPTVTVGKRISDRFRVNVITGLSESRDVRSNVEWQISPNASILGNYDNLNDVTSQGLGNLGIDFRIRLEF